MLFEALSKLARHPSELGTACHELMQKRSSADADETPDWLVRAADILEGDDAKTVAAAANAANEAGECKLAHDLFRRAHTLTSKVEFRISAANMSLKLGDTRHAVAEYTSILASSDGLSERALKMVSRKLQQATSNVTVGDAAPQLDPKLADAEPPLSRTRLPKTQLKAGSAAASSRAAALLLLAASAMLLLLSTFPLLTARERAVVCRLPRQPVTETSLDTPSLAAAAGEDPPTTTSFALVESSALPSAALDSTPSAVVVAIGSELRAAARTRLLEGLSSVRALSLSPVQRGGDGASLGGSLVAPPPMAWSVGAVAAAVGVGMAHGSTSTVQPSATTGRRSAVVAVRRRLLGSWRRAARRLTAQRPPLRERVKRLLRSLRPLLLTATGAAGLGLHGARSRAAASAAASAAATAATAAAPPLRLAATATPIRAAAASAGWAARRAQSISTAAASAASTTASAATAASPHASAARGALRTPPRHLTVRRLLRSAAVALRVSWRALRRACELVVRRPLVKLGARLTGAAAHLQANAAAARAAFNAWLLTRKLGRRWGVALAVGAALLLARLVAAALERHGKLPRPRTGKAAATAGPDLRVAEQTGRTGAPELVMQSRARRAPPATRRFAAALERRASPEPLPAQWDFFGGGATTSADVRNW